MFVTFILSQQDQN